VFLSLDGLARNLDSLRRRVLCLTERSVHIVLVKGNLTFTGKDSPPVESVMIIVEIRLSIWLYDLTVFL
jgi:DNA invertase Pin-like site-specific DNA recombinase